MLSLKFWLQWTKLTGQLTEFLTEPELDFLRLGNKGKGRMDLVKIFLGWLDLFQFKQKTKAFSSHFFHKTTFFWLHMVYALWFKGFISLNTPWQNCLWYPTAPRIKVRFPCSAFQAPHFQGPPYLLPYSPSYIHIPNRRVSYSPHTCSQPHTYCVSVRLCLLFILPKNTVFPIFIFLDSTFSSRPSHRFSWWGFPWFPGSC